MAGLAAAPPGTAGNERQEESQGPLRRCIVTGSVLPKERLVRFVLNADGALVPDIAGRLPRRGLWLQARRDVVETACAKGSFAKAAHRTVSVPDRLADRIEALLRRRCLDLVGLARRAGQVASGFEQVRAWLREGRAAVLIAAIDGAESGRGKMSGLARELPLIQLLTAAELGAALGRERAVHVALARGVLAERLVIESMRLAGFVSAGGVTLPSADAAGRE